MTTDIGGDRLVHLVAADAHGTRIDDTAERQHGHFRCTAADVHHHRTRGFGDRKAGAKRCGHRLFDQIDFARTSRQSGFLNGAAFNGGRAGRHTNNDLRIGEGAAVMHFADEVLDHFFGDFEVGNHAVTHRPDRLNITGRPAKHQLGLFPDS